MNYIRSMPQTTSGMTKPQDVFLCCALAIWPKNGFSQRELGETLGISLGEISNILLRCRHAKLVSGSADGARVIKEKLYEYLVHGVPVAYPPKLVAITRGVPTAGSSPLFRERFGEGTVPLVWPWPKGKTEGQGLLPLYPTVPAATTRNDALYELMAAVDVLRVGKAREKEAAETYLRKVLDLG